MQTAMEEVLQWAANVMDKTGIEKKAQVGERNRLLMFPKRPKRVCDDFMSFLTASMAPRMIIIRHNRVCLFPAQQIIYYSLCCCYHNKTYLKRIGE